MPYTRIKGLPGKVFVLEESAPGAKKHNCPDCASCQWCSDARCAVCLKRRAPGGGCSRGAKCRRRRGR